MKLAGNRGIGGYSLSSTTVTPPPPWWSGAGPKLDTNGCARRNSAIDRAQLPGAVAVDDPDAPQLRDHRLVEESLDPRQRFVRRAPDHVQLRADTVARLHLHGDANLRRCRDGGRRRDHAQIVDPRPHPFAAHIYLRCAVVHRLDDAFEAERTNRDAIAERRRPASPDGRRRDRRLRGSRRRSATASSDARASARADPMSPVGTSRAARRSASAAIARPVSSASRRRASISRRASRIRSSSR